MAKYYMDKNGNVTSNKNYQSTPKYNLDENGNITQNLSLPASKKKPKYMIDANGNVIATEEPKKEKAVVSSKKKEKDEDTWFKSGAFGDGKGNFFTDALATVGSTLGDVGVGVAKGLTKFGEGAVDFGMYGVAGAADFLGADNFAKDVRKTAKKNHTESFYKPAEEFVDKYSVLGNKADALSEGVGQVAGILLAGKAGALAKLGKLGVTALTSGVNFISSAGSGMSEAYQSGASDEEAASYGFTKGGIDAGTELMFGGLSKAGKAIGISKGIGGLDDMAADLLFNRIKNQAGKSLAKYGFKAAGEGLEEVAAGYLTAHAKQIYSEEDIDKLMADENLLDQFIVGSLVGGIVSSPSAVRSVSSGRDYTSGFTANEQKVVDAEVERRIAEQETEGKKLNKKEQAAIIEEVQYELKKGYISTDVIESTLVGESDTYKNYQSVTKQEQTLMQKIKDIENDETLTTTQKNDLTNAFKNEIKALNKEQVAGKFVTEMDALTEKDNYLRESYNELGRSKKKFTADLSKYNDKEKEVIQAAMDSEVAGNSNQTHEFVDKLAKIYSDKGIFFKLTNNEKLLEEGRAVDGATVNGYVTEDGVVVLNVDSKKSLNTIVGHEITHTFEKNGIQDKELQDFVIELSKTRGDYDAKWQQIQNSYSDERLKTIYGKDADFEVIRKAELTADLIGDYLFTDRKFIENLSVQKPNIFKRIYEELKYLLKTFTGSKEARQLEQVKRQFDKLYKQSTNTKSNEDIQYDLNAIPETIDKDIENNRKTLKDAEVVATVNDTEFEKGEVPLSKQVEAYFDSIGNSAYNAVIGDVELNAKGIKDDLAHGIGRIKAITFKAIPEVISKGKIVAYEKNWKGRNYDSVVIAAPVNVRDSKGVDTEYMAGVIVKRNDGRDIQRFYVHEALIIEKDELLFKTRGASQGNQVPSNSSSSIYSILQSIVNGNNLQENSRKYSISEDNQGRKLSKEQKEYFKDSKAVDKNGKLVTVYHGSPDYGFNVFNNSKSDDGMSFFFTNDSDMANSYVGDKDKLYEVYLNLKNPYVVDAKGHKWNQIRLDENDDVITGKVERFVDLSMRYDTEIDFGSVSESLGYLSDSVEYMLQDEMENLDEGETSLYTEAEKEELRQLAAEIDSTYESWDEEAHLDEDGEPTNFAQYLRDHQLSTKYSTRKIAKIAKENGNDGVIIKNVYDNGKFHRETGIQGFGDVYIAFDSNQIKRVDNTNPTTDDDIRHSLSNQNQDIAPVGSYNVYGRDIALKTKEPAVVEDIAPVREVAELPTPLTEEMANERDAQQQNIDTLVDAPEEIEAPYYAKDEDIKLEDPFDERDIKDVGKRNVKAYMYDNPEVKPYFQQEAQAMLWELQNSVKGEKQFNSQLYYDTNGELGWFGTTRETSDDIAYLLDNFKYTYADIEKGLKAIIEDHGAENNAISKRIEFALNDRLKDGYTDFMSGEEVPANQDYVNLLMDKQIYTYSDEAYYEWLQSLATEEAPPVAPLEPSTDDIAPVREDIETPEGVQRVMDFEKNQIVDEFESDTKEQENKLYHKSRKELKQALIKDRENFLIDAMDNAKNVPALLLNNTDTIRATELVFGRENAKVINKEIFQKAIDNEAKSIAWQNKERADIKKLGIKPKSKESAAVQKYGEKQYENAEGKMVEYGDIELATEFPDTATQKKIKRAAQVMRDKYDSYIDEANAVLTELGFNPIQKRKDYMRHFEALTDAFSRMGIPFNIQQMKEYDLPTDINGLTDTFVPQKNFFANIMERKGNKTTLDAVTGIDGYIGGISNLIHHTEDIQRGRAFEDLIRDNYGRKEADKVLSGIVDETAKQKRKQQIADNHLSSYASWVHDWTDNLAGKKDIADRGAERRVGRRIFTVLDTIRKQVGANMIGFNVASSLTNLIAPVQALAKTDKIAFTKGTIDTFKSIFKKDSFMENNSFLTSRMGTDKLSKTWWEKTQDAGFIFMRGMDYFTSNLIVRSKYNELISKGASEEVAHKEAGQFAARIMGDRTKGANAQLYNSKLFNMVAQFQLEVNNQLYSMFYDTYQESKEKAKGNAARTASGMTFTLGQLFIATHIFGQAFEEIAGYNPTFDLIDIIKTALGLDDEEEEKPLDERLEDASLKLLKALPYSSLFVDGGRIPMGDALPITQFIKGEDEYGNEKPRGETFMEALPYYLLPAGYGQMKKTEKGLNMFDESLPVTGSYTDSGNLRFPVEDTASNRLQAAIFGQWANENARDYINNERQPLKEKQIQEFTELDMPIQEYWEYREGLKEQKTIDEKFDYIAGLDLPVSKKNILINNVVDREEKVDLINYDDFSGYEEFDFAIKNPEKYEFFKSNNISYADYSASEESKEAYSWAYNNPEKYVVSKAIGDVVQYKQYSKELNELTADKDEDGKSISGSRKEKVINYINSMQADYGAKIVLYKSEYPSDDTYNNEIIEYLNNRNDITYDEMATILIELGFTVEADGTVRWD